MSCRYIPFLLLLIFSACDNPQQETSSDDTADVPRDSLTLDEVDQRITTGDSTATNFFKRAKFHFNGGDLQSAADDIIQAIARDSTQIEYFYLLSDIQLNAFQSRRALQSLQKAVSLEPTNRKSLLKLMELQILLKQYIPAIGTSQQLLTMDPQDDQVFFLRGLLFKEQNEDSLAIVNLQRTVDLNPDMTDAFIMLGDLHEKKSSPLAGGYYRNAMHSDPDNLNALHAYAFYLQNHGEMDEALDIYDRMITIDPNSPAPLINSAVLYMEKDSFGKSIDLLERAESLDSTFALTPFYLGKCLTELGDKKEAKAAFGRALELDPEFTEAQKALNNL